MLFTMYHLYRQPDSVKMTFSEFVAFANSLIGDDADVKDFIDSDTTKTLQTLKTVAGITDSELTAEELYETLSTSALGGMDISLFSLRQLYGLYFYDSIPERSVDFGTMLAFLMEASEDENVGALPDAEMVSQLKTLSAGIAQFEAQMDMPMDGATLKGWFYQNYGVLLTDAQIAQIYGGYFATTGEPQSETIPFLPLMKFLVAGGQITDPSAMATIDGYDSLYWAVREKYGYETFLPTLTQVATALSGTVPQIAVTEESVQQLYILYFLRAGALPDGRINGSIFAEYALATDKANAVVHAQLSDANRDRLTDMLTVAGYCARSTAMNYDEAYEALASLQRELVSDTGSAALEKDKVSGVYIKYAINNGMSLTSPVMACELLDFVGGRMETNTLLRQKMTDGNRQKVSDAQADRERAEDMFLGDRYSRMLVSVDLPNGSEDTTAFVRYLSDEVKRVFGDDAYIAGEIVSTYDLEQSFAHDNLFITVFTLISIFIIVMMIFRSLSLPVILVATIQGAIFIAMSTQLLGNSIFFMSYIVSTCILMGATIDYGILMSSNYVAYRGGYDKKQALSLSVEAAMPTVFTSGLILTVCGFVIHFISSQNSISTVGLLIGIGTICSIVMITIVLPSVLYLCDPFVLKLSWRRKHRDIS